MIINVHRFISYDFALFNACMFPFHFFSFSAYLSACLSLVFNICVSICSSNGILINWVTLKLVSICSTSTTKIIEYFNLNFIHPHCLCYCCLKHFLVLLMFQIYIYVVVISLMIIHIFTMYFLSDLCFPFLLLNFLSLSYPC